MRTHISRIIAVVVLFSGFPLTHLAYACDTWECIFSELPNPKEKDEVLKAIKDPDFSNENCKSRSGFFGEPCKARNILKLAAENQCQELQTEDLDKIRRQGLQLPTAMSAADLCEGFREGLLSKDCSTQPTKNIRLQRKRLACLCMNSESPMSALSVKAKALPSNREARDFGVACETWQNRFKKDGGDCLDSTGHLEVEKTSKLRDSLRSIFSRRSKKNETSLEKEVDVDLTKETVDPRKEKDLHNRRVEDRNKRRAAESAAETGILSAKLTQKSLKELPSETSEKDRNRITRNADFSKARALELISARESARFQEKEGSAKTELKNLDDQLLALLGPVKTRIKRTLEQKEKALAQIQGMNASGRQTAETEIKLLKSNLEAGLSTEVSNRMKELDLERAKSLERLARLMVKANGEPEAKKSRPSSQSSDRVQEKIEERRKSKAQSKRQWNLFGYEPRPMVHLKPVEGSVYTLKIKDAIGKAEDIECKSIRIIRANGKADQYQCAEIVQGLQYPEYQTFTRDQFLGWKLSPKKGEK